MGLLDSMRDYHLWVVGPQSTEHHALPVEHLIVEELLDARPFPPHEGKGHSIAGCTLSTFSVAEYLLPQDTERQLFASLC